MILCRSKWSRKLEIKTLSSHEVADIDCYENDSLSHFLVWFQEKITEAYLEPSQISTIESFCTKIVNGF